MEVCEKFIIFRYAKTADERTFGQYYLNGAGVRPQTGEAPPLAGFDLRSMVAGLPGYNGFPLI